MNLPQRPEPAEARSKASLIPVILAALGGVAIAAVFTLLSGGYFALVLVVGALIFALGAFHYVVWGWWLSRIIEREVAAEERDESEDQAPPGPGSIT